MLNEITQEWLETRNTCKKTCDYSYCMWCKHYNEKIPMWEDSHCGVHGYDCPVVYSYYDDAVMFEMYVAAFMAKNLESCALCKIPYCKGVKFCGETRMKWARICVEEELEKKTMN